MLVHSVQYERIALEELFYMRNLGPMFLASIHNKNVKLKGKKFLHYDRIDSKVNR